MLLVEPRAELLGAAGWIRVSGGQPQQTASLPYVGNGEVPPARPRPSWVALTATVTKHNGFVHGASLSRERCLRRKEPNAA